MKLAFNVTFKDQKPQYQTLTFFSIWYCVCIYRLLLFFGRNYSEAQKLKNEEVDRIRVKAGRVLGSCVTDKQFESSKRYLDLAEKYTGEKIRRTRKFIDGFNCSVISRLEKSKLIKPTNKKANKI